MTKPTVEETRRIICRNEVAATIERCAQVAERYEEYNFGPNDVYAEGANASIKLIAAAIRALRDTP